MVFIAGSASRQRRLKVLKLYAKAVSLSDGARLAGLGYETARTYAREADVIGVDAARRPIHKNSHSTTFVSDEAVFLLDA